MLENRLNILAEEICSAGAVKRIKEQEERQSRTLAKMHREELLRRQAALETEIDLLYLIPKRIRRDSGKEVE
jgi:hypothetical protein